MQRDAVVQHVGDDLAAPVLGPPTGGCGDLVDEADLTLRGRAERTQVARFETVRREPRRGLVGEGFIAVVTPNQCGDGMSDRAYGMEATVILGGGKAAQMLRGCCRLTK